MGGANMRGQGKSKVGTDIASPGFLCRAEAYTAVPLCPQPQLLGRCPQAVVIHVFPCPFEVQREITGSGHPQEAQRP